MSDAARGESRPNYGRILLEMDEAGNEQPHEPPWNLGGYANNAVQAVRVTVTP